jgi:hypothetical protein
VEVHKAKPIHNWREFITEVATIILGVLIALGAEELVEEQHWRHEVAIVEDSLDDELSDALFSAQERLKMVDCQQRALGRLAQLGRQGSSDPVIPDTPLSRARLWGSASWEAAVGSGAIAHMPHDRRNAYAELFSFVRSLRDWNSREVELWATINAYHAAPPTTADSRERFQLAVSQLKSLTTLIGLASRQLIDAARPLNIHLRPEDAASLRQPLQCPSI